MTATRMTTSNLLSFFLPLEPKPAPRPRTRVIALPGRKPIATVYNPKDYQTWQKEAADLLKRIEAVSFSGPVTVDLVFDVQRPKSTKLAAPKPDLDNYVKSILDCITKDGRFWADDTQVVELSAIKRWADRPGIHITLSEE